MNLLAALQTLATAYMASTGSSLGSVSTRMFSDSKRLDRAFTGKAQLTLRSFEAAMIWFSANWPADTTWPAEIARPQPEDKVA